jgi:probable phosphoglycerate mutase
MKKITGYISALLLGTMFLTGCQTASVKQPETAVTATQTETEKVSEEEPAAVVDTVTLYITRHGKTMLNTSDRSQGWIDAPLTPAGVEVARALGRGLKSEGVEFDAVYTSDSGRAIETAEIVLKEKGQDLEIHKDKRLREFNFGTYEGMPNEEMWEAVAEAQGITLEDMMASMQAGSFMDTVAPFADTLAQLDKDKAEKEGNWPAEDIAAIQTRLQAAFGDIVKESMDQGNADVLVVSHGLSIGTFLVSADANAEVPAAGLKNASVSKVVVKDGVYTVETVNDLSYVEKGK